MPANSSRAHCNRLQRTVIRCSSRAASGAGLNPGVRHLTPATSMAGAEAQQPMMFPLKDRPMVMMPY